MRTYIANYCSILFLFVFLTPTFAQSDEAIYIYRNDGAFNAFLDTDIDSMVYTRLDTAGLWHNEWQAQLVYTSDSLYYIPLSVIDSVAFSAPPPKYHSDVFIITDKWLPYTVEVTEETIIFKSDVPSVMLPVEGQVVVSETYSGAFSAGFAGRVSKISKDQVGSIVVLCDDVELIDIYETLICVGKCNSQIVDSTYIDGGDYNEIRSRINTVGGKNFVLPNLNISMADVSLGVSPQITLSYVIKIEPKVHPNILISARQIFDCQLQWSKDVGYVPQPATIWLPTFIPIVTGVPGLYGKIKFGGFFNAVASLSFGAIQNFTILKEDGFVWDETKFGKINKVTTTADKLKILQLDIDERGLDIGFSGGLATQLSLGICADKIASLNVTAYTGLRFSIDGLFDSYLTVMPDPDAKLCMDAFVQITPSYRYLGGDETEFPLSIEYSKTLHEWYLLPSFSNLRRSVNGDITYFSTNVYRNLLFPVSVGISTTWSLADGPNFNESKRINTSYSPTVYRTNSDLPSGLTLDFTLKPGKYYFFPTVKLFGRTFYYENQIGEFVVDPGELNTKIVYLDQNFATIEITNVPYTPSELDSGNGDIGILYNTIGDPNENNAFYYPGGSRGPNAFNENASCVHLSGLKADCTYYYKVCLRARGGKWYSDVKTFRTPPPPDDK